MASSFKRTQQGFSLVEAMVSVLLVAILGLGVAYATSRVLVTQRFVTTQNLAILQMREYLQSDPDKHHKKVFIAGQAVDIDDATSENTTISIGIGSISKEVKLPVARSLTVTSAELFSGDGQVSLTY